MCPAKLKKYFKIHLKKGGNAHEWEAEVSGNHLPIKTEHFSLASYIPSNDYSVSHLNGRIP